MDIKQLFMNCQWLNMFHRLIGGETAENIMDYFYYATSGFQIRFIEMPLFSKPYS